MSDALNAAKKYVATHRPESLEWGPFEGLGPDIVEDIRRIKSHDGPDLILWGSSTLTSTLLEHDLADDVLLLVYPVLLGKGKRFFAEETPPRWAFEEPTIRSSAMRFMMMVIYESAAPDAVPTAEAIAKMMEYNKALQKAGVLLALDGLLPPSTGTRISYADGKATVTDGPFAETKEVIGGYWIIQVRSREEAIEWTRRAPMSNNEVIEVRQIHEMPDFPEDVQKVAEGFEHRNVVH